MNFIRHIFKKHLVCILSIGFLIIFAVTMHVFAVDEWPYAPGATLNPGCSPTTPDCKVTIPAGGTLFSTLTAGNTTGGKNIVMTSGDKIVSSSGKNEATLSLDATADSSLLYHEGNLYSGITASFDGLQSKGVLQLLNNNGTDQIQWFWPTTPGGAGTFLKNDGSGNLSWEAAGGGASIVRETYVDLSAAQIKILNSHPVDTGISVGAGEAIEVISASMNFTANTEPYHSSFLSLVTRGSASNSDQVTFGPVLDRGTDLFVRGMLEGTAGSSQLIEGAHLLIQADADSDIGDGTARIYITYRIINL